MIETLRNAWKVDEIRKKVLFTLVILLLYRIGNAVTVPYVDTALLQSYFQQVGNTALGFLNVLSGSALSQASIFALSIQPYINASIFIQLLTIAIPALERLAKEGGEEGRKKIASITRYATIVIGLIQGFAYYMLIKNGGGSGSSMLVPGAEGIWPALVIIFTFTSGSALVMWLGEQITEFGIGNGISIILFANIVSRFPSAILTMIQNMVRWFGLHDGSITMDTLKESLTAQGYAANVAEEQAKYLVNSALSPWLAVFLLIGALALVVLIVIVNDAERRIPVQYSQRVVGRKMYGGQATNLPMKVNMSGVLPIIFAQSIATLPATVCMLFGITEKSGGFWGGFLSVFNTTSVLYAIIYLLLIVFFAYFYSTIQFNPIEVANNLKNNGGFIPGIRPGRPTSDFLSKVLNKITLFGAVYLGIIAVVPIIVSICSTSAANSGLSLGGTSIIIVVGVALETVRALEAQMIMRNYKGFLE